MTAARWVMALTLVILASAPAAQATFPGRNGGIAFDQRTSSGDTAPLVENTRLAVRPPGSAGARILLNCELTDGVPSGGDCSGTDYGSPSYSADGSRIVFDAGTRLGLIDAGGGPVTLLPAVSTDDGNPAFAPGGNRIVFTGINEQGRSDLFVRRLNGGSRLIINDATEPGVVVAQCAGLRAQRQRLHGSTRRDGASLRDLGCGAGLVAEREAAAARSSLAEEHL